MLKKIPHKRLPCDALYIVFSTQFKAFRVLEALNHIIHIKHMLYLLQPKIKIL